SAHLCSSGTKRRPKLILPKFLDDRWLVARQGQVTGSFEPLEPNQAVDAYLGESSVVQCTHWSLLTISTKGTMSSSSVMPPWATMRFPCCTNAYRPGAIKGR